MKRFICTLLVLSMLMIMAACHSAKPTSPKNAIMPSELSAGQQDIIDLLSIPNNQELLLFDFNTEESYSSFEVWVEVYQDGDIINRFAGLGQQSDTDEKHNGRLAVIISQNENVYQWTLSIIQNGGRASSIGTTEIIGGSALARAYGPMNDSANIEDGKEIIIYSSLFSGANILPAYDCQSLQERPELLKEFPYVYLIKCKFSNGSSMLGASSSFPMKSHLHFLGSNSNLKQ